MKAKKRKQRSQTKIISNLLKWLFFSVVNIVVVFSLVVCADKFASWYAHTKNRKRTCAPERVCAVCADTRPTAQRRYIIRQGGHTVWRYWIFKLRCLRKINLGKNDCGDTEKLHGSRSAASKYFFFQNLHNEIFNFIENIRRSVTRHLVKPTFTYLLLYKYSKKKLNRSDGRLSSKFVECEIVNLPHNFH